MAQVLARESSIHIAGYACRLPGAASVDELWTVLRERRCTIGEIGAGRWPRGRYLHPRQGEPGKAYTFRAGTLEAPWSFDPAVFGISPREVVQIDPQQRLLLELVWEALEDAGVPPSRVAGTAVGVYVGASSVDHGTRRVFDAAGGDAYYMTGSALSLIANRISYCFDFSGPSLVVDTACSSSLVALHQAVAALRDGTIDTAVVAGVNILLNPFPFIGFSSARMLSPEGLCRAFSAHGQGYVRSEGGVVMVLARDGAPVLRDGVPHARIIATGVNSDGKTVGVSLPSYEAQGRLLRTVHDGAGVDPNQLAFIEAHGTGTRVGDPIEARAIGEQIGQRRKDRLPIGSVKSNVGHLEPASGLVGLLKASLALRHDMLPATLHAEELNPDIPFDDLNLHVAQEPVPLPRSERPRLAGVSTFGFGGTNAHVVIADPLDARAAAHSARRRVVNGHALGDDTPPLLGGILTARTEPALTDGARRLAAAVANSDASSSDIGAALAHHRELLSERAVVIGDLKSGLDALAAGTPSDQVVRGTAIAAQANVAFVFCGNGSQWAGMGRVALGNDPIFRRHFTTIDALIQHHAGWSAIDMLAAEDLADRIRATSIAQPLLFALQAAAADTLRERGLEPTVVIGHSVGEVAAAYAAGHYDRESAVRLILTRSASQEFSRGAGRMAVLHVSQEDAQRFLDDIGAGTIEIAAVNSPSSVTLVGPTDALADMLKAAEAAGLAGQQLDIEYPFHSRFMDGARAQLHVELADLTASPGHALFISTVDAARLDAVDLDAEYWWRNIRMPVLFADAIRQAAAQGAGVFVEIGPRAVLRSYLDQTLRAAGATYAIVPTFSRQDKASIDALATSFATAITRGARFDVTRAFGPPPASGWRHLPHYAWQRTQHLGPDTTEAIGGIETTLSGPTADGLLGYRGAADVTVWHSHLDTAVCPELGDHCVAGKPWLPAAAFADMALSAAQVWLGHDQVELRDFDISRPLVLSNETTMDVRTSIDPETATCEIASRQRQSDDVWQVHVRCRVAALTGGDTPAAPADHADGRVIPAADVYALASDVGLDYGPAFRRLSGVTATADGELHVAFDPTSGVWPRAFVLSPTDLDGVFHGLFSLLGGDGVASDGKAFIPVRLGRVRIFRPSVTVARAVISDVRGTPHALRCNLILLDAEDGVVAQVEEARFVAAALKADRDTDRVAYHFTGQRHFDAKRASSDLPNPEALRATVAGLAGPAPVPSEDAVLLLDAAAQRAAYDVLAAHAGADLSLDTGTVDGALATALALARQGEFIAPSDDGIQLLAQCPVPPLDHIIPVLIAEHPDFGAECALLADAAAALAQSDVKDHDSATPVTWTPATATWQHFRQDSPRARAAGAYARAAVAQLLDMWPADRPLRLLQLGADIAAVPPARLQELVAAGRLRLVIADSDPAALQTPRAQLFSLTASQLVELDDVGLAELAQLGPFDAIVSFGALDRLDAKGLAAVHAAAATGAVLLAVEPHSGPYNQLVLGLARSHKARIMPVRDTTRWRIALERAGFAGIDVQERVDLGGMIALSGIARETTRQTSGAETSEPTLLPRRARILAVDEAHAADFAAAFDAATRPRSRTATANANGLHVAPSVDAPIADAIVVAGTGGPDEDPRRTVADTIALLKATLADTDTAPGRIWVVAPGGARHLVGEGAACPVATAIWSLVRTVANEHPGVDFRAVDVSATLDSASVPARLAELIAAPGFESEIILTTQGHVAMRAASGVPGGHNIDPSSTESTATLLGLVRPGSLQSLRWDVVDRRAPADDEVEIEVAAAGLNFRDVMWAMGMLPAEALEDGFAGPTVGFECSGTVVRKGARVSHLAVGDRAFAMAPAALASHVTVAAAAVGRIPQTVDPAAAATVPVAFLTAHYALNRLGQLRAGDWVLIHGGAGGVGLAALQIAQAKGARVIATAGTREKRELLRHLGADHVFSSRSLAFYDEIRAVVPQGVDIVLNSLAGEAMERSLELVRPFGRFLELGKRDYYENSKIALRPFRRNISYFGIDVDQLMQHDPRLAQELMTDLVAQLERGELRPLPYRRFEGAETLLAFRLMQQSGHIGKIVVTPPAPGEIAARPRSQPFAASPDGAHLVIGGLGGFGMATATWLADHGARTLVLVSRSGAPAADAETAIAALRARDVDVLVEACDVADADAVAGLLDRIRGAGNTLRSVFHCAMVIEDGVLANLDRDAVERVLAPKIDGARHLDRLTRADNLDHFVLYSSATTLFGNPGQSSYVAANGYLEGLAHARAAAGLPALAVAWGAIGDTGYLARNTRSAALLGSRTGVIAMTANEALHHLDVVLSHPAKPPLVTIAPVDWQAMTRLLPVLKRPTFSALAQVGDAAGPSDGAPDLAAEIEGLDAVAAQAVLTRHLTQVIASIMRTAPASVETRRPLVDMGIDSLMSVELQLAAKERFGMELPLGALVDGATIEDLAGRLLQRLRSGIDANEVDRDLVAKHLGRTDIVPEAIAAQ